MLALGNNGATCHLGHHFPISNGPKPWRYTTYKGITSWRFVCRSNVCICVRGLMALMALMTESLWGKENKRVIP